MAKNKKEVPEIETEVEESSEVKKLSPAEIHALHNDASSEKFSDAQKCQCDDCKEHRGNN